jgi:hypothetical protein
LINYVVGFFLGNLAIDLGFFTLLDKYNIRTLSGKNKKNNTIATPLLKQNTGFRWLQYYFHTSYEAK